jgi:deazaflavin-dependent oxidoreductase (nitroreductase family)
MLEITANPNRTQRAMQRVPASRPGAWFFARTGHLIDRALKPVSRGRATLGRAIGVPEAFVTTTGAKSGKPRTMPLLVVPDGRTLILVASNWGQSHNPGWYYNMRQNPAVTVEYQGQQARYTAREVTDLIEYNRYWDRAAALYSGYARYALRATRRIPLVVLEPEEGQ